MESIKKLLNLDFFNLLIDICANLFHLLIRFLIQNWLKSINFKRKLIKNDVESKSTFNWNPIYVVRFQSDGFCHSNSEGLESKLSTIQFWIPNHLSLHTTPVTARCENSWVNIIILKFGFQISGF